MRFSIHDFKRRAWGVLPTAVLMTTFLFGCGGDPYAGKYAKAKPTPQMLVGDWKLKAGSPGSNPTKPTKLTLRADGSFTVVNYPGAGVGSFGTAGGFLDGDGTWSVQQHQSFWVIGITWQKLGGKQLDYGQMLHILNDAPPHVLRHIIGDPDSGEALVFEKVPGTNPN
jgi:hypothetical protein